MSNVNLTSRDLAIIKRVAMNVDSDYQKVIKINAKIEELQAQAAELQTSIDEMEAPVLRKTGGYKSTDIYEKVVTPMFNEDGSVKTDKNGHPMKVTKYVLRYGENIFPPVEENTAIPTTEFVAGNDFDVDSNNN